MALTHVRYIVFKNNFESSCHHHHHQHEHTSVILHSCFPQGRAGGRIASSMTEWGRNERNRLTFTWPDMCYSHEGHMGGNLPHWHILTSQWDRNKNSNGHPPFSMTAISTELMAILPEVTGSGKSKMAVYKLVLSIYRLVDEIERRFQQKTLYLR